jgi:hypothetical protein
MEQAGYFRLSIIWVWETVARVRVLGKPDASLLIWRGEVLMLPD